MGFEIVNILDAIFQMQEVGLSNLLSTFSCPKNLNIEHFLRTHAVSCAKQRFAITYLILNAFSEIVGFFTLAHKPMLFDQERLAGKCRRRIRQFCVRPNLLGDTEADGKLLVSTFLIAQLGKNFTLLAGEKIAGREIVEAAMRTLSNIQKTIGGGVIFLECEDQPKLLDFYSRQGFIKFGERSTPATGEFYHQMVQVF